VAALVGAHREALRRHAPRAGTADLVVGLPLPAPPHDAAPRCRAEPPPGHQASRCRSTCTARCAPDPRRVSPKRLPPGHAARRSASTCHNQPSSWFQLANARLPEFRTKSRESQRRSRPDPLSDPPTTQKELPICHSVLIAALPEPPALREPVHDRPRKESRPKNG
jgi:hypothetical protein